AFFVAASLPHVFFPEGGPPVVSLTHPPQLSIWIHDPNHVAELGFIVLLAITASMAVGVITDGNPLGSSGARAASRRMYPWAEPPNGGRTRGGGSGRARPATSIFTRPEAVGDPRAVPSCAYERCWI